MNELQTPLPAEPFAFISYSRADVDYIDRLHAFLEQHGISWWQDKTGLGIGDPVAAGIVRAIEQCACIIVVMSESSVASTWVPAEVSRAFDLGKPVYGILLSGSALLQVEAHNYFAAREGQLPGEDFAERVLGAIRLDADRRSASATHEEQAAELLAEGIRLQETGDYQAARRAYVEILELGRREGVVRAVDTAHHQLGIVELLEGRYDAAEALFEESLRRARSRQDMESVANALASLGQVHHERGELEESESYLERAYAVFKTLAEPAGTANQAFALGHIARAREDTGEARRRYEEAIGYFRELGDKLGIAQATHQLGLVAAMDGRLDTARDLFKEALRLKYVEADREGAANSLYHLSRLEALAENFDRAAIHQLEALELRDRISSTSVAESAEMLRQIEEEIGPDRLERVAEAASLHGAFERYRAHPAD